MLRTTPSKSVRRITPSRNAFASYSTDSTHEKSTGQQLRELLRHTAQPVAVVTSLMRSNNDHARYHGATLSSFASIAMDPYPLVSFSLRIPSRMAFSLKSALPNQSSHMVINLLSSEQATIAVTFSRSDLYPEPFLSVPYRLTQEGVPVLEGSLGALSCKLVSTAIPLHDLDCLEKGNLNGKDVCDPGNMIVSELFIGRVVRVEKAELGPLDEENPRTLPLLYHRRGYTTCLPPHTPSPRESK
jgi:flavin reductase (DIM6/NTAB) family NADH-FMN oxidoreductase RutF